MSEKNKQHCASKANASRGHSKFLKQWFNTSRSVFTYSKVCNVVTTRLINSRILKSSNRRLPRLLQCFVPSVSVYFKPLTYVNQSNSISKWSYISCCPFLRCCFVFWAPATQVLPRITTVIAFVLIKMLVAKMAWPVMMRKWMFYDRTVKI